METERRTWNYSEVIGAMLRQERKGDNPVHPESVVEQLVRQLEARREVDEIELDLGSLVQCPECEPGRPCPACAADREEMARQVKDHLRRVKASGIDPVTYLNEADDFHQVWQDRFEQLHLAAMGGETLS